MGKSLFSRIAPYLLRPLTDAQYAYLEYWWHMGRPPCMANPGTLNEKIQWLKLYYREPLLVQCQDKFAVRGYVSSLGLSEILIPLLGVFDRAGDIRYDDLPDQFILKATHGSGWNVICRSRASFDSAAATATLAKYLRTSFYRLGREWAYKHIRPRIVCEALLLDAGGSIPPDYKFHCFNGEPRFLQVEYSRFEAHTRNFYDLRWNRLPLGYDYPNNPIVNDSPPDAFPRLLEVARSLCAPFPYARVDLYILDGRVFFGEFTFYPRRGLIPFVPAMYDRIFGSYLDLTGMAAYGGQSQPRRG